MNRLNIIAIVRIERAKSVFTNDKGMATREKMIGIAIRI